MQGEQGLLLLSIVSFIANGFTQKLRLKMKPMVKNKSGTKMLVFFCD